jgi:hypothetical protein
MSTPDDERPADVQDTVVVERETLVTTHPTAVLPAAPTVLAVPVVPVVPAPPPPGTGLAPVPQPTAQPVYQPLAQQPVYQAVAQQPVYQPVAQQPVYAARPGIVTDRTDQSGQAVIAWILTVLSLGYFLPWAIAATRGRSNAGAIGLLNLFVGWTLIGWIITLVMACAAHQPVAGPQTTMILTQHYLTPQQPVAAAAPSAPAGWYPSPSGEKAYWDGIRWTGHTAP